MKKQHTEQTAASRVVAVAGDDRLTQDLVTLLESKGFTTVPGRDKRALHSAGTSLAAGFDISIADDEAKKASIQFLDEHLPASAVLFTSSVFVSATLQASWVTHPERLIGLCAFPTLMNGPLIEAALPVHTTASTAAAALALLAELGKEMVSVQDRVGMIFPGMLSQVVNEALFAVQQNVASPEDIDTAMKTGAGYPMGPIEWGEKIGFANIVRLLDAMRTDSGEERYRVAPLLRQLSLSGKFWSEKIIVPEPVQEVLQLDDAPRETAHEPGAHAARTVKTKQERRKKSH